MCSIPFPKILIAFAPTKHFICKPTFKKIKSYLFLFFIFTKPHKVKKIGIRSTFKKKKNFGLGLLS